MHRCSEPEAPQTVGSCPLAAHNCPASRPGRTQEGLAWSPVPKEPGCPPISSSGLSTSAGRSSRKIMSTLNPCTTNSHSISTPMSPCRGGGYLTHPFWFQWSSTRSRGLPGLPLLQPPAHSIAMVSLFASCLSRQPVKTGNLLYLILLPLPGWASLSADVLASYLKKGRKLEQNFYMPPWPNPPPTCICTTHSASLLTP